MVAIIKLVIQKRLPLTVCGRIESMSSKYSFSNATRVINGVFDLMIQSCFVPTEYELIAFSLLSSNL